MVPTGKERATGEYPSKMNREREATAGCEEAKQMEEVTLRKIQFKSTSETELDSRATALARPGDHSIGCFF